MHKHHSATGLILTHSEDDPMDLLATETSFNRRVLAATSWLALVIAFAGCTTKEVLEPCGPGGQCDLGYVCNANNECARVGDGAAVSDAARLDSAVSTTDTASSSSDAADAPSTPDAALPATDAAAPDLRVPDAAGTCGAEGECSGAKPFCAVSAGLCVECLTSKQCTNPNKPICIANTCTGCKNTTTDGAAGALLTCKELDPGKPVCNPDNGSCVECAADSQCGGATPLCIANKCQSCVSATAQITCAKKDAKLPACGATGACVECADSGQCSGATPLCVSNKCQPCGNATDQITCAKKDARFPVCGPGGACVECTTDSQCSGTAPLCISNRCQSCAKGTDQITCAKKDAKFPSCNPDDGACVECTAHSQCSGTAPLCIANKCQSCAKGTDQITCAKKDASHPVCGATGACLECTPNTPVCDTATKPNRLYQCDATGARGTYVDCEWGCKINKCLVAKRVFVSRGLYTGNMGGLAGADRICNNDVLTGLAGAEPNPNFKAWLSDTVQSVADRFTHNDGPYIRMDKAIVANNWTELTTKGLQNSISRDVAGEPVEDLSTGGCYNVTSLVWSSTGDDGSLHDPDVTCGNWTDSSGFSALWGNYKSVGDEWTTACAGSISTEEGCGSRNRLYCFEQ